MCGTTRLAALLPRCLLAAALTPADDPAAQVETDVLAASELDTATYLAIKERLACASPQGGRGHSQADSLPGPLR
jgi:hypothetical protein